jgi:hypothetical protein
MVNDVILALGCVHRMDVGRVADVSEVHVYCIFRVEARYEQTPAAT